MSTQLHVSVTAIFISEGLHKGDISKTLYTWGKGYLELIYEVASYAEYLTKLQDTGYESVGSPGVFDYEVCQPFGTWVADYINEHDGRPPSRAVAMMKAINMTTTFYGQGLMDAELKELKEALTTIDMEGV